MTLQQKLYSLYAPFLDSQEISCSVYHYTRGNSTEVPYIVWAEDGERGSLWAANHKAQQQLSGIVDLYTLREFDPIADAVQDILNGEEIGWSLDTVQYEPETNLIHFQWRWWVG